MKNRIKKNVFLLIPLFIIKEILNRKNKKPLHPVWNINKDTTIANQKKILISYTNEYILNDNFDFLEKNTRSIECSIIVKTFITYNYCIDIVHTNDTYNIKNNYYDIILGFGEAYRKACSLNPKAIKTLYLTERHPKFSYLKEKERIDYYYARYKRKVPLDRSGLYYSENDFNISDTIIYLGTKNNKEYFPEKINAFNIVPTGLKNKNFFITNRDLNISKYNFLWLGSRGAIHKGLDIILEVFKINPRLNIFIAGLNSVDRKILNHLLKGKNIYDLGYIPIHSEEFIQLASKCAFTIFPSCSEAVNTGVITAMNHGLIPIITKETLIELNEIIDYVPDYKVETINLFINKIVNTDIKRLNDIQHKIATMSSNKYSTKVFKERFNEIVFNIDNNENITSY